MPQVDLETLVPVCAGGGDRKIACETLADGGEQPPEEKEPDFPPESFWLSKDAEYDWFDRNAFYERKESTKGNSNSTNLNPSVNPTSTSSSQRFVMNLKSKASIIGLPKTQTTNYIDTTKRRTCKPENIRLFPKRSEPVGKSASMTEPSSPKVSCMGRVRSKRGRRRQSEPAKSGARPAEKARRGGRRSTGIYGRFISIFRSDRRSNPAVKTNEPPLQVESPPRKSVKVKARDFPASAEPETAAEPPGLGGMKRFASCRRSASFGEDDVEQMPGPAGRN